METLGNPVPAGEYADLPTELLDPDPAQPRKTFDPDALAALAESVRERGQLQPVRVRPAAGTGRYVILTGERRYRACRLAGLPTVRCQVVTRELTPGEVLAEQLEENLHRPGLPPLEEARAFRDLMELEGLTGKELAARLHLHPSTVSRALALLDQPAKVRAEIANGNRAKSAARPGSKKPGRKPRAPRGVTITLRTPKRWVLTLATPRKGVSEAEVAAELEALAARLRAKAGGEPGPRLAGGTAPAGEAA